MRNWIVQQKTCSDAKYHMRVNLLEYQKSARLVPGMRLNLLLGWDRNPSRYFFIFQAWFCVVSCRAVLMWNPGLIFFDKNLRFFLRYLSSLELSPSSSCAFDTELFVVLFKTKISHFHLNARSEAVSLFCVECFALDRFLGRSFLNFIKYALTP